MMAEARAVADRLDLEGVGIVLGGRRVVDGVSLALAPGEIVGVIGANGAGKSTLLRAAAGLVEVAAGTVRLDGQLLGALDRRDIGRSIAYLPQERTVHWPVDVRTVVGLGRLPHRTTRAAGESAADRRAVAEAMAACDVDRLARRNVLELSGGERARVLLARALAQDARILIADEPTAGLDPAHQLALFANLQALAANGRSIVVALHDLSAAARYCTRVLALKDGRSRALGAPGDILTPALLADCYDIRATIAEVDGVPVVVPLSSPAPISPSVQ